MSCVEQIFFTEKQLENDFENLRLLEKFTAFQ
jgi:hypothetical protein